MNDLKDFVIFALKNPLLWGVAIVWINANIQWLLPSVPTQVLNSFTDLFSMIGVLVVAYLGGKDVERKHLKRTLAKSLLVQQETSDG